MHSLQSGAGLSSMVNRPRLHSGEFEYTAGASISSSEDFEDFEDLDDLPDLDEVLPEEDIKRLPLGIGPP